jgi:DNA-binding transcriptional LysR family regulator
VLAKTLAAHYPLIVKPHPLALPEFEIALYWHDRYHRDPANKWLRDLIVQQLAAESTDAALAMRWNPTAV